MMILSQDLQTMQVDSAQNRTKNIISTLSLDMETDGSVSHQI